MQMLASGSSTSALFERLERLSAQPWLPYVINGLALVLLTAGLAHWTWQLVTPAITPNAPLAAPVARTNTAPAFNLQTIQSAQLFGVAPLAAGSGNIENIPLSSLNLALTGLIAAGDKGVALIRVEGQPEAPFAIGDTIVGGAVLHAVHADRAIIMRNGVAESLLLEGAAQPLPGTPTPAPPIARGAITTPGINPEDVRQQGPNSYVVSRDAVTKQMRNPQKMLSQSLMVPNPGGGFVVREIQPGSIYEHLGLKLGDVIRSANGQPLNSMDDVVKLYQQSSNFSSIQLEVLRNGRVESLQYNLQ